MSFIADHVCQIGGQIDRCQIAKAETTRQSSPELREASAALSDAATPNSETERLLILQTGIKAISTVTSARSILTPEILLGFLEGAGLIEGNPGSHAGNPGPRDHGSSSQEKALQWLLVSKATNQAYGLVLSILLDQIIPLSSGMYYWNSIVGSARYTGLYTMQTSPSRLWNYSVDIYSDARERLSRLASEEETENNSSHRSSPIAAQWRQFYALVQESVRERSLMDVQAKFMTPFTRSQRDAKSNLKHLRRIRNMTASALGVLMDEGMMFDPRDEDSLSSKAGQSEDGEEWKTVVSKSVTLIEAVLRNVTSLEQKPGEFEETVFANVDEENGNTNDESEDGNPTPVALAIRLQAILDKQLPSHLEASRQLAAQYGRPSRWLRYWPLGVALFFSSSTLLRVFLHRKAEILQWVQDLGATTRDFWFNWVVDPVKKIVGTIRHDKNSEIAIMSKESLQGDRASLERMVVDFALEVPSETTGKALTDAEIADVRYKVREGDITPVLRAYEHDLQKPFRGATRGNLIRTLLIQVQKTKVDVEVALGGIDNLLKSQELVFGFVGLTPGILVCIALSRWLGGVVTGRQDRIMNKQQGGLVRPLRNIDRILTAATPVNNGMLSYKEHGLLLCEVHLLRQRASKILPSSVNNDLLEDLTELIDLRTGVDRQVRVVERIRWAYARWLH